MRHRWVLGALLTARSLGGCTSDADWVERLRDQRRSEHQAALDAQAIGEVNAGEGQDASVVDIDGSQVVDTPASPQERDSVADETPVAPADAGCDPESSPSSEGALFVSKLGVGDPTGAFDHPFDSLSTALTQAVVTKASVIYVDVGTYEEPPLTIGQSIAIVGGVRFTGFQWKRICADDSRSRPVIKVRSTPPPAPNVGLKVTAGHVTLRRIELATEDGATIPEGEGQSTYAIWATGVETLLQIDDTKVSAGKGGDGAPVSGTLATTARNECNGLDDCSAANEVAGDKGPDGEVGKSGRFVTLQGFRPEPPLPGQQGGHGKNGVIGLQGSPSQCVESCGWSDCQCRPVVVNRYGRRGTCGCGGTGGAPGKAGNSGGASVAVYVEAGARLSTSNAELEAGNGGAGTAGSDGVTGEKGSRGVKGADDVTCFQNCNGPQQCSSVGTCVPYTSKTLTGGTEGGAGGEGGKGGRGGAAFGGPSISLVAPEGAILLGVGTSTLRTGRGGAGGAIGLNGMAQQQWTFKP